MNLYPPGAIFCRTCGYCLHALTVNRCPECGHGFDPADPKTFRARPPTQRLKWVVRAGVVVLLLAAVPVGYWAWLWWGWKAEQPVLARLTAKGATIKTIVIGPDWAKRWMTAKAAFMLVRAKEVVCNRLPVTDGDLLGLENLAELQLLELSYTQVTDASLPAVGRLRKLSGLWLPGRPITSHGMESLRGLRQLETLNLCGTAISAPGLEYLSQNQGLRSLSVSDTQIGDESVDAILRLGRLQRIWLTNCRVTDAGLLRLAALPALVQVYVSGANITEAGCQALRQARPEVAVDQVAYRPAPATGPGE